MTSKETYRQISFFSVFVHLILEYTFLLNFREKSETSAGGFNPSPATRNEGSSWPDLLIGNASAPCTKPKKVP